MPLGSPLSLISPIMALLFEGLYVVTGIIVLVLAATVAADRKGLVALGGVVFSFGALCNVVLQACAFYFLNMRILTPDSPIELLFLLRNVSSFVFLGGLLVLVLAATKRPAKQTTAAPPPPPPPYTHSGPQTPPTR